MTEPNSSALHCVVIGAGTVGSCCAWHLARSGVKVTLVDRTEPGQSTSFGNAAGISPSQVVPFSHPGVWKKIPGWLFDKLGPLTIRWQDLPEVAPWLWRFWRSGTTAHVQAAAAAQAQLMRRVREDFDRTLQQTGLQHYLRSKGIIVAFDRPEHFTADKWTYELAAEYGFEWNLLSPQALQQMAPALKLDGGVALYVPSWQHVINPAALTAAIAEAALAAGVQWRQEKVLSVSASDSGVRVNVSGGKPVVADRLVIAAGPWSNQLAAQLDYTVPMTPKRGYHTQLPEPGFELEYPVLSGSRNFVMTPLQEGFRMAGTAEFARLDAPPDYRRAQVLVKHARHYFPMLQEHGRTEWMGQRPMMADSLPVISPSPAHRHVFYAFGHGHYGLTQGPTTGEIIAQLVTGQAPGVDLHPFRFERFK
jgi:D-amino-acid dehydrogenase